jgi:hypothetical protein
VGNGDQQEQPATRKPDDAGVNKAEWAPVGAVRAPSA